MSQTEVATEAEALRALAAFPLTFSEQYALTEATPSWRPPATRAC